MTDYAIIRELLKRDEWKPVQAWVQRRHDQLARELIYWEVSDGDSGKTRLLTEIETAVLRGRIYELEFILGLEARAKLAMPRLP